MSYFINVIIEISKFTNFPKLQLNYLSRYHLKRINFLKNLMEQQILMNLLNKCSALSLFNK